MVRTGIGEGRGGVIGTTPNGILPRAGEHWRIHGFPTEDGVFNTSNCGAESETGSRRLSRDEVVLWSEEPPQPAANSQGNAA
jgi:hypothetical protein